VVEAGSASPAVARAIRSGAVFWVTAAARPALPQALRAGVAPRYLVAPGTGRSATFTVAGCDGWPVGAPARGPIRRLA